MHMEEALCWIRGRSVRVQREPLQGSEPGSYANFGESPECELRENSVITKFATAWPRNVCRNAQETVVL